MNTDFTGLTIITTSDETAYAAQLFAEEIEMRTGVAPSIKADISQIIEPCVIFRISKSIESNDTFELNLNHSTLSVTARGIRGLIYGFSMFLRKTLYNGLSISLLKNISGLYSPAKSIRGHQLGYRGTPNAYDAWDYAQYFRYYRDLMYFCCNTVEHIPYENGKSQRNNLMKYDEEDFLVEASRIADTLDLDVSLWYPNSDTTTQSSLPLREKVFGGTPRINIVFPPGGDPGHIDPDELIERCNRHREILKKYHPDAQIWPSAQQPHEKPDWGEEFIEEMNKMPDCIDGVITGPNRAFPLDTLRRRLPAKYPIRLYPDITHNVRCEYPVHFERDDWHYALCTALSREAVNPRPTEYRLIHRLTERYVAGSVSYSEGVNDDLNKAVWSDMDFFPNMPLRETIEDYARLFFPGSDVNTIADGLFALEKNWEGAPDENPFIESTYSLWFNLGENEPSLYDNWRYVLYLFRSACDVFVRRKMLFENDLINTFEEQIYADKLQSAEEVLNSPFPDIIVTVREKIEECAKLLFELIGMQLDVKRYGAQSWERGATLETIDLPITDREWLKKKLLGISEKKEAEKLAYMRRILSRNTVLADEYYYSVALNGLSEAGVTQQPDFYMDFQGDRPSVNNGSLPVCMFKLFDHFSFSLKTGGFLTDTNYILIVTYKNSINPISLLHRITANGNIVYEGRQFGGSRCEKYERDFLPDGYTATAYDLPKEVFVNGCLELSITEPFSGFKFSELRIIRKEHTEAYI